MNKKVRCILGLVDLISQYKYSVGLSSGQNDSKHLRYIHKNFNVW